MRLTKDFLLSFLGEASRWKQPGSFSLTPQGMEAAQRLDIYRAARKGKLIGSPEIPYSAVENPSMERAIEAGARGIRSTRYKVGHTGEQIQSVNDWRAGHGFEPRPAGHIPNVRTAPAIEAEKIARVRSDAGHRRPEVLSQLPKR